MRSAKVRADSSIKTKPVVPAERATGAVEKAVPKNGRNRAGATQVPASVIVRDIAKDGLKAFTDLMEQLQSDSGATLLFAHHLSPEHHEQLAELLALDSRKEADEAMRKVQRELAEAKRDLEQRSADSNKRGEHFSNVLRSINIPMILVGEDSRITGWSAAAEQEMRLSHENIGHKVTSVLLSVRIPGLQGILSNVLATGNDAEQEVVDDAERCFLLHVSPLKGKEDQVEGAVLTFHNMDAEKQNKTLLRSSQAKEQKYLEVVPGILMLMNAQGNLVSMNKSGCELLGTDEADLVGKNWVDEYVPRSHQPLARTFIEQAIEGTLDEEFECPVTTEGGEE